jgi:hypothetical protein
MPKNIIGQAEISHLAAKLSIFINIIFFYIILVEKNDRCFYTKNLKTLIEILNLVMFDCKTLYFYRDHFFLQKIFEYGFCVIFFKASKFYRPRRNLSFGEVWL